MTHSTFKDGSSFPVEVGETIRRTLLQEKVGGANQWGMTSCRGGTEFLIFHNPSKSKKFGYDVWEGEQVDGTFSYTGQGVKGDQKLTRNNKKLIEANRDGKPIHLFHSVKTQTTYLGRVVLGTPNFTWKSAPQEDGPERKVLVFNLIHVDRSKEDVQNVPTVLPKIAFMDWTAPSYQDLPGRAVTTENKAVERIEMKLKSDFGDYCKSFGTSVRKMSIPVSGKKGQLVPDFYLDSRKLIVEAKASNSREYVRLAVGQILDYLNLCRLNDMELKGGILIPSEPTADLVSLIKELGLVLIVRSKDGGFEEL